MSYIQYVSTSQRGKIYIGKHELKNEPYYEHIYIYGLLQLSVSKKKNKNKNKLPMSIGT